MKISIIGGTGNQGKGLALRLASAGFDIVLGSRTVEKAQQVASELKKINMNLKINGAENIQAGEMGEIIILTIPYQSMESILPDLRSKTKGKVVIDTSVALRPGKPPTIDKVPEGSVAQKVQRILGDDALVVSAFHTVSAHLLNNMEEQLSGDTLVASDHQEAKALAVDLAEKIGLRALDAGSLKSSSILEELTAFIIGMNIRYKRKKIGINFCNV